MPNDEKFDRDEWEANIADWRTQNPRRCGAAKKNCSSCDYRYPAGRSDLTECPECGAERPCASYPKQGAERCRMHGGASRRGAASGRFRTGRYSEYMPQELRRRYEAFLSDPDLLAMDDEVAALQARQGELLNTIANDGHPPSSWVSKVTGKVEAIDELLRDKQLDAGTKQRRFEELWAELSQLAEAQSPVSYAWKEFSENMEQMRRIVATEQKRRVDMHYLVSVEDALALIFGVLEDLKPALNLDNQDVRERFDYVIRRAEGRLNEAADDPRNLVREGTT